MDFLLRAIAVAMLAVPVAVAASFVGWGVGAIFLDALRATSPAVAVALNVTCLLVLPVAIVAAMMRALVVRHVPSLWGASRPRGVGTMLVRAWPFWCMLAVTAAWLASRWDDPGLWLLGPLPLAPVQGAAGALIGHVWTSSILPRRLAA